MLHIQYAMLELRFEYEKLYTILSFSSLVKKDTVFKDCRNLTINLDLVVLQCLSSLISGHTGISPGILLFSIENLQGPPTCESMGDE